MKLATWISVAMVSAIAACAPSGVRVAEAPNPAAEAAVKDVTENLTARWAFDDNAEDSAPHGKPNDGEAVNKPTCSTTDKKVGAAAIQFESSKQQYVKVANGNDLLAKEKFSICVWIKPVDIPEGDYHGRVLDKNHQYRLLYNPYANGGKNLSFDFFPSDKGKDLPLNVKRPSAGEWHHLAATYDGAVAKLYVDGIEKAKAACSGKVWADATVLYIGNNTDNGVPACTWNGLIDDVRFYDGKALTQEEIKTIMAVK